MYACTSECVSVHQIICWPRHNSNFHKKFTNYLLSLLKYILLKVRVVWGSQDPRKALLSEAKGTLECKNLDFILVPSIFTLYSFYFFSIRQYLSKGSLKPFSIPGSSDIVRVILEFSLKTLSFKNIKFYASNQVPQMNHLLKFKTISFGSGRWFSCCFFLNVLDWETEMIVDIHGLFK